MSELTDIRNSRIETIWSALHDNRMEDAVESLPIVLGIAAGIGTPKESRVHALCAACATARAARWPAEVEVSFGWAARITAGVDSELMAGAIFRYGHALVAAGDPHLARAEAIVGRWSLFTASLKESRLYGALLLLEAVSAARDDLSDDDWSELLDEAEGLAGTLAPPDPDPWHTEFSLANIAAHRIHLLVATGRGDEARAVYEATDFSGLSDERRAAVAEDLVRNPVPTVDELADEGSS